MDIGDENNGASIMVNLGVAKLVDVGVVKLGDVGVVKIGNVGLGFVKVGDTRHARDVTYEG